MEQIIKEYGRFILGAAVCICLLLLFAGVKDEAGNRGIFHILGAHLDKDPAAAERDDCSVFAEEGSVQAPTIVYCGNGALYTGDCRLDTMMKAVDGAGNELVVQMKHISGPRGMEWSEAEIAGMPEFSFPMHGIYRITVAAVDAWNRSTTCVICVPVNDRREAA